MAMMVGGMMIHGIIPGPQVMTDKPGLFWGMIASMWLGNLMLVVFNLPLVGIWVKILQVPYSILFAIIMGFMLLGAFATENSAFDIYSMLLFGVVGYCMRKLDFPLAPAVLTLILGPLMEKNLRRSLEMSQGDFGIFLESPIAVGLFIVAAIVLLLPLLRLLLGKRAVLPVDAE
jgi:putative tricarboxylic transport membrane protein